MRGLVPWLVAALGAALARSSAAQARPAINLVTHSEVVIDRPAAAIWPSILDPSSWKQGARLVRRGGPVGQVGEVFAAVDDAGNPAFFVENVELVPHRRRTIKLYRPDGELLGHASWWLASSGAGTVVGYDVYSETRWEAGPVPPTEQLAAQQQAVVEVNQRRFDAELQGLKRQVEARP